MLLFIAYSIIAVLVLKHLGFFKIGSIKGYGLYIALFIKLGLTILLYHLRYDGMKDSLVHLHDSKVLSQVLFKSPLDFVKMLFGIGDVNLLDRTYMLDTNYWSHESTGLLSEKRNMIRINAMIQLISLGNPYVVFFWNSVISLLGLKMIYSSILKFTYDSKSILFLLVFLLPSTLLWTSGVMKEGYIIFGIGLYLSALTERTFSKKQFVLTLMALVVMLLFKQYIAVAFGFGFIVYLILKIETCRVKIVSAAVLTLFLFAAGFLLSDKITQVVSYKQFDFMQLAGGGLILRDQGITYRILEGQENKYVLFHGAEKNEYFKAKENVAALVENHDGQSIETTIPVDGKIWYIHINGEKSGSHIQLTPIHNNTWQLIKNIPEALFNSFFRPLPKDPPKTVFKWYFIFENFILTALFLFALKNICNSNFKVLIIALLISCLIIALFIGWITPVVGALVRYKIPITISIIAMSWLLLHPKKEHSHALYT